MANEAVALGNVASDESDQGAIVGNEYGRRRSARSSKVVMPADGFAEPLPNVDMEIRQDAGLVVRIRGWKLARRLVVERTTDEVEGQDLGPSRKIALTSKPQVIHETLLDLDPYQAALPLLNLMNSVQNEIDQEMAANETGDLTEDVDGNAMQPLLDVDDGVDYVCVIINGTNWNRRGCNWSLTGDLVDEMDDELDDDPDQTEFWIVPRTSLTEKDLSQLGDINDYDLERIGACQSERMRFIKNLFKKYQFRRVRDLYAARRKGHVSIARYISLIFFVRL